MASCTYVIQRKSIDVTGTLGSFYDASRDKLINKYSLQAADLLQSIKQPVFNVFQGDESTELIDYLKKMDFDDELRLSILLNLIQTSGVSSLIKHNQPINKNILLLYYSYRSKVEESSPVIDQQVLQIICPRLPTSATHMITRILWGFEILCLIPISEDQSAQSIYSLLATILNRLNNNQNDFVLSADEKGQINQLINVTVYGSETCINNRNTSLLTILNKLKYWQQNENLHRPLIYTMYSLGYLYNYDQFPKRYHSIDETQVVLRKLQAILIPIHTSIKKVEQLFENIPEQFSNADLDKQWNHYKQEFFTLLDKFVIFQNSFKQSVQNVRRNLCEMVEIEKTNSNKDYKSLQTDFDTLYNTVYRWFTKIKLIERLNNGQIRYINALDIPSDGKLLRTFEDIHAALRHSLVKETTNVILWYSSDKLKRKQNNKWEEIYNNLTMNKNEVTNNRSVIYVDCNQCQPELTDYTIVSPSIESLSGLPRTNLEGKQLIQTELSVPTAPSPISHCASPAVTEVNVLLLGETGVGKSTFINAFVNYLLFDSLQLAEHDEPVVLIPVSFLTTVGHQFDEVMVKFGDVDPNENFEHEGQSVTQQCQSYVFHLNDNLLLRLIDTPGMGDTRGLAQDDKNINHILTYVNSLSHINAICLLLKPNASRLNIFFRSCIQQLFTYLTPLSYPNIIFCFTNARSTFYAPGDTGPLLRKTLKQEDLDAILFEKQNTFCFDSESFRYLAARKCGVEFDDFQKKECTNSWTTSVRESVRLLKYILNREPYYLNEWESPRKAALEISILARSLMETLRLTIYKYKLREVGLAEQEMILSSNPITIQLCSNCAQSDIIQVGPLWIVEYAAVRRKTAQHCECPFDQSHFLIESTVKYGLGSQPIQLSQERLQKELDEMLFECDKLIDYLRQKGLVNEDSDPFDTVLERFLEEERNIADVRKKNGNLNLNKGVREQLRTIKKQRQTNKQKLINSNETRSLNDIYEIIQKLTNKPVLKAQIESIKTSRRLKMEVTEYPIKLPPNKNKLFSALIDSLH